MRFTCSWPFMLMAFATDNLQKGFLSPRVGLPSRSRRSRREGGQECLPSLCSLLHLVGMWEDLATGMAAGPLGALLISCGLSDFGRIVLEPGTATGGTSFISVDVGEGMVCISGAGVGTASGCIGATP